MTATVRQTPIEIANALTDLGLDYDTLREAILRGETGRDNCTPNDPPSAPGFYAWGGTVRALRDILIPRGWRRSDDSNFSRVVSPDGLIAIAVTTGDSGTGRRDKNPRPKYSKGVAMERAVVSNSIQLELFEEPLEVSQENAAES